MAKTGLTKARRRDFEPQLSELWGNKNDLSAQLQIQLIGFEPNLSHFSFLKSLHLFFVWLILPRNDRGSRAINGLRVQSIC